MNSNSTHHRHRLTALLAATTAAAAVACSGQGGLESPDQIVPVDFAPEAALSSEEREAEFEQQLAAQLSPEERAIVERRLEEIGVDPAQLGFAGRLVTLGDSYLDADALLRTNGDEQGAAEKGKTLNAIDNTASVDGFPVAPKIFSQIFNGNYQFARPDIDLVTIVVPNGAAASFLVGAFETASNAIWSAANDCLSYIDVQTQAEWDALSFDERRYLKPIFVRYGSSVCPGFDPDTRACALFPHDETRDFGGLFTTRLVPGSRIGVVSTKISSNTTANVGSLTHELMHTLGIAHSGEPNSVTVIQTSSSTSVKSIMQLFCTPNTAGCNYSHTLTSDDVDTIDTLYSPQPGSSCIYRGGLKTLVAN